MLLIRHLIIGLLFFTYAHTAYAEEALFFNKNKWNVSGYLKLEFAAANNQPTAIEIDDLSLFISGNINRWINPFIEAELYQIPLWQSGEGLQFDDINFIIERLYNDSKLTDATTLRLGKFLAPVSRWNLLHAAPLVWTTSRPLTTKYSFANYISGIHVRHELDVFSGHALEFYWQPYEDFYPKPRSKSRHYQSVYGASWILQDDLDRYLSFNIQHANVKHSNESRTTIGINGMLHHEYFELESELLSTWVNNQPNNINAQDWGGYLQLSVPIPFDLNIISRYEHFEFSHQSQAVDTFLNGLVYRPYSKLSLKLEWQQSWGSLQENKTGLYASVAVMF